MRKHKLKHKFLFSSGLQKATILLKRAGLVREGKFPILMSAIEITTETRKNKNREVVSVNRFLVKIQVRDDFDPKELWLKFDKRGQSVYISPDQKKWVCLNSIK
jgi:hypothetical protein